MYLKDEKFVFFFKKILYKVLFFNLILSIVMLVIIRTYIPSPSAFKAEGAYKDLYESIPYFANFFRYSYTTQNSGYLAFPFFFYYLSKLEFKKSRWALLLSSSSMIAGIAFYSRAQIFTYVLVFIGSFFLLKDILPKKLNQKILRYIKIVISLIVFLFISITVTRFSEMDYYKDRIPRNSRVKDPIIYSIADYTAQGYYNGVNRLEKYTPEKILYGEGFLRLVYQYLNFFNIITWNAEKSKERVNKSFDGEAHLFYGYTCHTVYNFGYIVTFLLSVLFHLYITSQLRKRKYVSIESLFILVLLLVISVVSIFYCGFELLYVNLIFFFLIRTAYLLKKK
ncbi:O-antigen polymerase [Aquimarina agarilytica]|uniref:O-antigen polymerase n=1 Tax=Aquimarina agarilytica TaxID=1087449 RepID=UPI0012FCF8AD|nr:O-antigen polymerase [Aquimarina agarilytica]